jgi:phosphate transport system substrate-binding protein
MNTAAVLVAILTLPAAGCTAVSTGSRAPRHAIIRITGSDTMINLLQAWAERYHDVEPAVSVQVAGGGSGVGFAALLDATADVAAASREMKSTEREALRRRTGREARQVVVALDGLAVYVARGNPLDAISIDQLAEIFGEGGRVTRWSALGVHHPACRSDEIIRIGRQNNSGTFAYFRDVVLGAREYRMGSLDQSGSKDVVALVSATPCAIGYSGMAFATATVKMLRISRHDGGAAIAPSDHATVDGSYPFARPLYLYTAESSGAAIRAFIDWTRGAGGQAIVREIGFVQAPGVSPLRPQPEA